MSVRRAILFAHRWLGLASAFVLSIAGATGAVLVWGPVPGRRYASALHERLALGRIGWMVVVAVTVAAVVIEVSGLVLWWKRRSLRVRTRRGWPIALYDLHQVSGLLGLVLMILLAVTGAGAAFAAPYDMDLRRFLIGLHTGGAYAIPVKVIYMVGSLGFVVQSLSGVVMWWKLTRRR